MNRADKRQLVGKKLGCIVILGTVCLLGASCANQDGKTVQTETSQSAAQTIAETISPGDMLTGTINAEENIYTFGEISALLNEQGSQWEAFYNGSGERIDMYLEDGTKLIFLGFGEGGEYVESEEMILVMLNDYFFKLGFQKGYSIDLNQVKNYEYFGQTAEYYLSETELMSMSQIDLNIALNEIYARHGRQVREPFLQGVFSQKTWYQPKYEEGDFAGRQDVLLNEYEKENIKAILEIQKKRGLSESGEVGYKVPRSIVEGSSIDLDGNGTREYLMFDFTYAGPYQVAREYMVFIDPQVPGDFAAVGEIDEMPVAVHAASLDGKTTQLVMSGKMDDGKPRTDIYEKQNIMLLAEAEKKIQSVPSEDTSKKQDYVGKNSSSGME